MAIMTTAGSPTPLAQSLARVRRRLRATHAADGLGVALAAGLALLLAWMWVDLVLDLPPGARIAADWVALGGGVALLMWRFARGWREGTDERVARRLDATAGSSGEVTQMGNASEPGAFSKALQDLEGTADEERSWPTPF